jgi:Nucleotidyl transferase AbiEii toxin, Type IV TA system
VTNRLVDDQDAVAVLPQQVADRIGLPVSHIEKDFWVTEVLRGVVAAAADGGLEVVFKGGTSLSKAFRLIQRFSEDVDLLVVIPGSLGTGSADTKLKALVSGASAATGLTPETVPAATSKGVKRGARFHYWRNDDTSGLPPGVFLEIGSRGGAMPSQWVSSEIWWSTAAAIVLVNGTSS